MMMKMIWALLRLVPQGIAEKIDAPMMAKDLLARGRTHPTIPMTLANLWRCTCSSCPSFPRVKDEALYCSGGKSRAVIKEKGCNCITCPLYDRCSSFNVAYFCVHGHCGAKDDRPVAAIIKDLAGTYLERFTQPEAPPSVPRAVHAAAARVAIHFGGEKDVETDAATTILNAALGAGIPHAHVCGGRARCSTCRVLVTKGIENCRPRNAEETRLARIKGFSPQVRLACQTTVTGDVDVRRLVLDDEDIRVAIQEGRTDPGDVGRERSVAVLFCDIRSFTAFSERALPYDVIHILNRYYETIGSIIDRHGGYIDKYMGDGIMVVFGLDRTLGDSASRLAVSAARDMARALPEFNRYLRSHFNHEFRIGIGIHTGTAILGSLGFHKKKEYTALGDTVNTASRIESVNKTAGTTVLVSEAAYRAVGDGFHWGREFTEAVKGKEDILRLHELLID